MDDEEALAHACAEHLKSGGDAITEAAFASGWQAALAYVRNLPTIPSDKPDDKQSAYEKQRAARLAECGITKAG